MPKRNPRTPAEWQAAVDAATAARMIADCKMYGLIKGGHDIDVARCDELLELGRARGVRPSAPALDLAMAMIARSSTRERPKMLRRRTAIAPSD